MTAGSRLKCLRPEIEETSAGVSIAAREIHPVNPERW